jgi:hypothetical protein
MKKYRHKESGAIVEAVTLDELIEHGRQQNPGHEGAPASFDIWGRLVEHEADDLYKVDELVVGIDDILIYATVWDDEGPTLTEYVLTCYDKDHFNEEFEPVE